MNPLVVIPVLLTIAISCYNLGLKAKEGELEELKSQYSQIALEQESKNREYLERVQRANAETVSELVSQMDALNARNNELSILYQRMRNANKASGSKVSGANNNPCGACPKCDTDGRKLIEEGAGLLQSCSQLLGELSAKKDAAVKLK